MQIQETCMQKQQMLVSQQKAQLTRKIQGGC